MVYYRCTNAGTNLPDSITIKGTGHVDYNGGRFDNPNDCSCESKGNTVVTIPTLHYKKADITASSSSVGIGRDIDISAVEEIAVTLQYVASKHYHVAYKYWYGDADGSYTVTLHN